MPEELNPRRPWRRLVQLAAVVVIVVVAVGETIARDCEKLSIGTRWELTPPDRANYCSAV